MSKFELSLAANYVSDWDIYDAVREFVQNAIDQSIQKEENPWSCEYHEDTQTLEIGNVSSVLEANTLLLGSSTKRDDEDTVGQFGEGYKIATLVAIRCGKEVVFYNYGKKEVWHPRMVKSRRYGAEILTFFTEKHLWKQPPDKNLTIVIKGITPEEYQEILRRTLALQENIDCEKTYKGTVLYDEKHKGMIFVNGLYVMTDSKLNNGYDIPAKFLKLDRDRKMVADFDLKWHISTIMREISNSAKVAESVLSNTEDTKFLSSTFVPQSVCNLVHHKFRKEHGEKAIPVKTQSQLELVMNSYTDAKPVMVNENVYSCVTNAADYEVKAIIHEAKGIKEALTIWFRSVEGRLPCTKCEEFLNILEKIEEE